MNNVVSQIINSINTGDLVSVAFNMSVLAIKNLFGVEYLSLRSIDLKPMPAVKTTISNSTFSNSPTIYIFTGTIRTTVSFFMSLILLLT